MQYQRRFGPYLINVLVAGIDLTSKKPFIAGSDAVGGMSEFKDFVCVGAGDEFALASCESKNLNILIKISYYFKLFGVLI